MPSKYNVQNLPEPVNKNISFVTVAPHKAAALRFSGYMNEKTTVGKTKELEAWLNKNNLRTKSGFSLAQYNPPWIPGPFRKNEIIVDVE